MTTSKESLYLAEWLKKSKKDFERVKARLEAGNVNPKSNENKPGKPQRVI